MVPCLLPSCSCLPPMACCLLPTTKGMWPENRHAKCTQFGGPTKAHSMINHPHIHMWGDVCLGYVWGAGGVMKHTPHTSQINTIWEFETT